MPHGIGVGLSDGILIGMVSGSGTEKCNIQPSHAIITVEDGVVSAGPTKQRAGELAGDNTMATQQ